MRNASSSVPAAQMRERASRSSGIVPSGGPSIAWIAKPRSRTSSCEAAKSTLRDGFRHDDGVGAPGGEMAERDRLRAHDANAVGERRELLELGRSTSVGPGRLDREELDVVLRAAGQRLCRSGTPRRRAPRSTPRSEPKSWTNPKTTSSIVVPSATATQSAKYGIAALGVLRAVDRVDDRRSARPRP